jgi:hypothetical protein
MALKRKITKEEHATLPDVLKSEYKAEGDAFILEVDDPAFAALKAEKEAAAARAAKAEKDLKDKTDAEEAAAVKAREDAARAAGDVAALEKSWKDKRDADVAAEATKTAATTAALRALLVDTQAQKMADEISTVPALMIDKIKNRMTVEVVDGVPLLRVLSTDGKPSALSVADLQKEFLDNPDYKAIIKGSRSSGGGAGGSGEGGGAGHKKLSEMTGLEEVAFAKAHPEEYKKMLGQ